MPTAEYLRELRINEAVRLLARWLQNGADRDNPTFRQPLCCSKIIRQRWWRRPQLMIQAKICNFWEIPGSEGRLYIAQNFVIVTYSGDLPAVFDPPEAVIDGRPSFLLGDDWKLYEFEDLELPMTLLDQVIGLLGHD